MTGSSFGEEAKAPGASIIFILRLEEQIFFIH